MPYGKFKDGEQTCVYKLDADGNRTGDSLGCHPNEVAADAQIAALYASERELPTERMVHFGGPVRAAGDGIVEGLLVPFTDENNKDLYHTYWNRESNLMLDDYPPERYLMLYQHGLDPQIGVRTIGRFTRAEVQDVGLWVQAQLDMRDEYERAMYKLAQKGKLGWSSGALPQGIDVDEQTGYVRQWPIIDGSLTPTPATPFDRTKIYTLRSYLDVVAPAREDKPPIEPDTTLESNRNPNTIEGVRTMDEEKLKLFAQTLQSMLDEILSMLGQGGEPNAPELAPEEVAAVEETMQSAFQGRMAKLEDAAKDWNGDKIRSWVDDAINAELPKAVSEVMKARAERERTARNAVNNALRGVEPQPLPGHNATRSQVSVGDDLRYAHLSAADMCMAVMMMQAPARKMGYTHIQLKDQFSDAFINNLRGKVGEEIKGQPFGKNFKANATLRSIVPFRADEQNATDIATQGTEWVGDYWSTTLWAKERYPRLYDTLVSKGMMVEEIPQGADTAYFPTEGADPTGYMTPEGNNLGPDGAPEVVVNINPFNTGNVSIAPKELTVASSVTTRLEEGSVIRVAQQASRQLEEATMEYRDKLVLNGDTTTTASTNINLIDGTPGTGLQSPYYLMANGLRKLPLVTYTAGSRDAGGGLTLEDYRKTMALMDGELRQYFDRCLYIIDSDTGMASLAIPELLTISERPVTYASIEAGMLKKLYNIDVFVSGFLPESNTSGKVSVTSGDNTQGSILLAYAPYWGFAYKRQMTLETEYSALWKSTVYVMSVRMGIVARGNNASVISYNVANA